MKIINYILGRFDKKSESPKTIEAEEAEWLTLKKDRDSKPGDTPDVALVPMGTDQEAGGAISTPSGRRKYS